MAGETILLADRSLAIQDITRAFLEEAGYRVVAVSNSMAALTCPEINRVDLVVLDLELMDTQATTHLLRTDPSTFTVPVLLLVPEEKLDPESSFPLSGANAYLVKPFTPLQFLAQVRQMLEERELKRRTDEYLARSADQMMREMSESHLRSAIDREIESITAEMTRHVTESVSQMAKEELNAQFTALNEQKEAELVERTVQEVARGLIEQMIEQKAIEATSNYLTASTDKVVRQVAETIIPNLSREKIKDMADYLLPREISRRVQAESEQKLTEISRHLVETVDTLTSQRSQKVANELFPPLAQHHLQAACERQIPGLLKGWVEKEIQAQMPILIEPAIKRAARATLDCMLRWFAILAGANLLLLASLVALFLWKASQ